MAVKILGDLAAGDLVRFSFNTVGGNKAPITLAGVSTQSHFAIKKDGSDMILAADTVTVSVDDGSVTGYHVVTVDTTKAGFDAGSDYEIRLTAGTIDSISHVGAVLATWSLENRTTALRNGTITTNTFDSGVLATDAEIADAVWAEDIGSPTLNSVKQYLVTNIPDAIAVVDGNVDSVLSDTTAILADTGTDGVIVASASTTAIASAVHAGTIITGTANTGATSTLIPFSAISPTLTVSDQLVGRVLIFKTDTTTAELRGQAATISASTTSSISITSAEAFTTAPASGDTFVVV